MAASWCAPSEYSHSKHSHGKYGRVVVRTLLPVGEVILAVATRLSYSPWRYILWLYLLGAHVAQGRGHARGRRR